MEANIFVDWLALHLKVGSGIDKLFLEIIRSYVDKLMFFCRARCLSVRLSSVEIISFRGNLLSNRPIDLKIGLNVREGVVHVRKA